MQENTYYKYKFGYINIDQNNIYFTSSGNWSETQKLKEKKPRKSTKKIGKIILLYACSSIFVLAVLTMIFLSSRSFLTKTLVVSFYILLFTLIKKHFFTEMGERFLIPKNKIVCLEESGDNVFIKYQTSDNTEDRILIKGLECDITTLNRNISFQDVK